MCDRIKQLSDQLLRFSSGEDNLVRDLLVCCQPNSLTEESLLVIVFTLIGLGWIVMGLLAILTCLEAGKVKLRARRRSEVMTEDDGFFESVATELHNGMPMSEKVVRGFTEIRDLYESLPNLYAERAAIKIAVENSEYNYVQVEESDSIWRSIVQSTREEEEPPLELESSTLVNTTTNSPWSNNWGTLRGKIRKLSEMRRADGDSNRNSFELKDVEREREESERVEFVGINAGRKSDKAGSFSHCSERKKKMSEGSIHSGLSISLISLNDEVYEELPRAHKSILRAKAIEQDRRYRRKRRHGVSFVEENNMKVLSSSYTEAGTV